MPKSKSKKHKKERNSESEEFAPATTKSKRDDDVKSEDHGPETCILHVHGFEHEYFTPLSKIKGSATDKLSLLHSIRDRRLQTAIDSPFRMEDVCNRIPESLEGANLETTAELQTPQRKKGDSVTGGFFFYCNIQMTLL